ncbi:hypothetical protein OF001_U40226 [Pseudomonas sp. OF001]|uniref:hypothetical protein n=1 Tax=Pseudomonas sp. OF001 TaxID=2772300 RepID=UPI001918A95B|nr:hypothetical protein [Pseudomonas sp. OF001]CAD5379028.1 hypothetical protein OF001_U40226 [Pseudomonas sp. OF001]
MELKNFFAQDDQGNLLGGATCYLYARGTENLAAGLQAANGTALANPFTADAKGLIQFAAPNGLYDLRVVKGPRDYRVRVQCVDVQESVADAEAAAGRAEVARDAAQLSAGVFADTAAGLAGTASGEYFSVPSASSDEYLALYRNISGLAQDTGKRYPSEVLVTAVKAKADVMYQAAQSLINDVTETLHNGTLSNGYIRFTDGVYAASTAYRTTEYIAINATDEIYVDCWSQSSIGVAIAYYDNANNYLGYELHGTGTGTAHPNYKLTIPGGATKVRVSGYNTYPPVVRRVTGRELDVYGRTVSDGRYQQLSKSIDTGRYGIRWQVASSSSDCERLGAAVGMTAQTVIGTGTAGGANSFDSVYPWSQIKRCAVSTLASGATRILYETDAGYAADGSAGDIMLEIPLFYHERSIIGGYEYRWISAVGTQPHPAFIEGGRVLDRIYVSAFEGNIEAGVLYSRPGVLPTSNEYPQTFLDAATAKGPGWTLFDSRTLDALQNLMWIEHGKRNSTLIIGHGISDMIQPRTDYLPIVVASSSTNTLVTDRALSNNDQERLWPGADILICDTEQANIVARRKVVSVSINSPVVGQSSVVVDGSAIAVTTSMFFGGAPQTTGQTDAMDYHTGRLDRAKAIQASTISRDRLNCNRYRRIENLCGNVWHWLPDVHFVDQVLYVSDDITDYEFNKVGGSYRPLAEPIQLQQGNTGGVDPVWATELAFDPVRPKVPMTSVSIVGGSETTYFGAAHYLETGAQAVIHGGGFDHKERTNIATMRAWGEAGTRRWYLYGARLQFKPI